MKSLMLATFNVCLFCGACTWAVRGSDGVAEWAFDGMADSLEDHVETSFVAGAAILLPLVFLGDLVALPIVMFRLGQPPYSAYQLFCFAVVATFWVFWWLVGFRGVDAAAIVANIAVPLSIASISMFIEVGYRKLAAPYWVLAGVGLLMVSAYTTFIIVVWAAGGKQ